MKHLVYLLSAVLLFGSADLAYAQSSTKSAVTAKKKSTPSKSTSKSGNSKASAKKGTMKPNQKAKSIGSKSNVTASKESVKSGDDLFEKKKRSWAIGANAGFPFVEGDVPAKTGLGYGIFIQKALGHTVSLRLAVNNGYTTGLGWKRLQGGSLAGNMALTGRYDKKVNYVDSFGDVVPGGFFPNYRMDYTCATLDGVIGLNNLNFMTENPRFNLFGIIGAGVFYYDTRVDALDAHGNTYDFSTIQDYSSAQKSEAYTRIREKLDGTYESRADGNNDTTGKLLDRNWAPALKIGMGFGYKISDHVSANLEFDYIHTGSNILDGIQYWTRNVPSPNSDAFFYASAGLTIRLGRSENVYWFSNPLAMPYKTIMEAKKKLDKVDKIEKDLADLNTKVDTLAGNMAALTTDSDGDGVSDYFDLEDNTPAGAIVDGSGRTIFYKDENGNLIYNDPNYSGTNPLEGNGNNNGGTGNNVNNNGSNNGGSANMNSGGTNKVGKKKTNFNKGDMTNKTIVMKGDGKGGLTTPSPGVMTSAGYMPAIFFESGSASVNHSSYSDLFEVARNLKSNSNMKVHVIGNTDYRMSETFNQKLGMKRAQAVADALVNLFGVDRNQLVVESHGKLDPLTNAKTMDALAANRRVQFETEGGTGGSNINTKSQGKQGGNKGKTKSKVKMNDPNTPNPGEFGDDMKKKLNDTEKKEKPQNKQQNNNDDF